MSQAAFLIGLLDGSRDRGQVIATAAASGIPSQVTERVLTLLAAGGALDDFPAGTLRELPAPLRARLAPELATASLAHGDGDGGARFLARRRASLVWIDGERRIARAIARILSTAGVGAIRIGTGSPANAPPATASARRSDADRLAAIRGSQEFGDRTRSAGSSRPIRYRQAVRPPDLTILVGRPEPELPARLVRNRVPHLAVLASEAIGVVGPLVIPGKTACLRCLDYVRAANDPSWPLILAQLSTRRADPPACDAVLAMAVAAQAAAQALTAIDKAPAASVAVNGTLELALPDWRWRRRTWPVHPACTCAGTPSDSRQ
jgi:bacteriocin biosynthesis cyclodehydratase domain-containing protein